MDPATLIILILLLLMVAIPVIMSLRLAKSTTQRSLSPAPASGNSTTATSASSGGGSSGRNLSAFWSTIPLVLAGLWLGAKIILFGGEISDLEIFILAILVIFAWVLDQKKCFISSGMLVILAIKLLTPPDMDTIVIDKDGVYELPNRPLKVCFKQTGSSSTIWIDQEVSIDNSWRVVENYSKCHNIPKYASGKKVHISLGNAIKKYTPKIIRKWNITNPNITNDYEYYANIEGGQSGYPIIQDQ